MSLDLTLSGPYSLQELDALIESKEFNAGVVDLGMRPTPVVAVNAAFVPEPVQLEFLLVQVIGYTERGSA